MKKIGIIVLVMLGIVILSMMSGKVEKKSLDGISKEQAILDRNKDKYSKHIRFYNRILNIDKGLLYYFEDAGTDKKFRTIQNEDITADIAIDKDFIDKLKELETSKERKDEMDKKAIAMIPILEKMMPITDEMQRVIMEGGTEVDIQKMAYQEGMVDLRRAGLLKVMSGITSLEEVLANTND